MTLGEVIDKFWAMSMNGYYRFLVVAYWYKEGVSVGSNGLYDDENRVGYWKNHGEKIDKETSRLEVVGMESCVTGDEIYWGNDQCSLNVFVKKPRAREE